MLWKKKHKKNEINRPHRNKSIDDGWILTRLETKFFIFIESNKSKIITNRCIHYKIQWHMTALEHMFFALHFPSFSFYNFVGTCVKCAAFSLQIPFNHTNDGCSGEFWIATTAPVMEESSCIFFLSLFFLFLL